MQAQFSVEIAYTRFANAAHNRKTFQQKRYNGSANASKSFRKSIHPKWLFSAKSCIIEHYQKDKFSQRVCTKHYWIASLPRASIALCTTRPHPKQLPQACSSMPQSFSAHVVAFGTTLLTACCHSPSLADTIDTWTHFSKLRHGYARRAVLLKIDQEYAKKSQPPLHKCTNVPTSPSSVKMDGPQGTSLLPREQQRFTSQRMIATEINELILSTPPNLTRTLLLERASDRWASPVVVGGFYRYPKD